VEQVAAGAADNHVADNPPHAARLSVPCILEVGSIEVSDAVDNDDHQTP
jgi:hypothetical protein